MDPDRPPLSTQLSLHVMALSGLIAVLLLGRSLVANGLLPTRIIPVCLLTGAALVLLSGACRIVATVPRCPSCGRKGLRRLRRQPEFHFCPACRFRCARDAYGDWYDAGGPKYESIYRPRTDGWMAGAPTEVDGTTCGSLLGRKRRRASSSLIALVGRRNPWPPRPEPAIEDEAVAEGSTCETLLNRKRLRDRARGRTGRT